MSEANKPVLFDPEQAQLSLARRDDAAIARAVQEIQAALVIGQRNPRNEIAVETRILQACQRKSLAELAEYEYSRGGTRITGPTIDLLRAIANRWGNLLYGWDEVSRENGYSRVRCWAWDTQSNARAERTFMIRHWRDTQAGGYALEDERDIYENNANQAARRVRACLEEVIDGDIIEKAIDTCRQTMRKGEKVPLKERAVQMVLAYAEFGVTQAMIEARLGNKLEAISENQLASLRRVYRSLKDGVGKREDYFKPDAVAPQFGEAQPAQASGVVPTPSPAPKSSPAPTPAPAPTPVTPPVPKAQTPEGPDAGESFENAAPAAQPTQPSQPETQSPLKVIRGLCKANKPVIREGVLLGFLAEVGITDGSCASLEELQISQPIVIKTAIEQWPDMSKRITAALTAGK